MMSLDWAPALVLFVTCGLIALGSVFVLAALQGQADRQAGLIFAERGGGLCFLFDGDALLDATPQARALLAQRSGSGSHRARLLAYLLPRFPDLETHLARLADEGNFVLTAPQDDGAMLTVEAELRGGLTRIALHHAEEAASTAGQDLLTQKAIQQELGQLRQVLANAPWLVWRETRDGDVVWANAAYLSEAAERLPSGEDLTWPLPRLFDTGAAATGGAQRGKLTDGNGRPHWFRLQARDDGAERLVFAEPADDLVLAEESTADFKQTLAKTFAHLPIGIAIFDRQRQLAMFNPALLDLTTLPPDFLSMRPTLFAVLDALRDRNMIPEPKDYRSWRRQMTELEQAASSGHHEETWTLPGGQTIRLTGRPHPNGALALMFEDITTEMSRIRRYRADLELSQSVLDTVEQALVVFAPGGALVMANASYAALWDHDPAAQLGEASLARISTHWRTRSAPSAFWMELQAFCDSSGQRDTLLGEVRLLDGRLISCRAQHLAGDMTLVTFAGTTPHEGRLPLLDSGGDRKRA
ncbi:PAS-domain containing protein [Gemmobacter caeruleus]|uniref:PAS-domain containing protein n=1 Tax=Gemmobacter caeruleus TaxID=2595004 RepID=UPI0011ED0394|nr:PAS-domain containing protein [Gemmobacter caeruleus]